MNSRQMDHRLQARQNRREVRAAALADDLRWLSIHAPGQLFWFAQFGAILNLIIRDQARCCQYPPEPSAN